MKLTYDTCLKLKQAGFPQKLHSGGVFLKSALLDHTEDLAIPTLTELIAACGNKFVYLHRLEENGSWNAVGKQFKYEDRISDRMNCGGDTPEEAVANLYLALRK